MATLKLTIFLICFTVVLYYYFNYNLLNVIIMLSINLISQVVNYFLKEDQNDQE